MDNITKDEIRKIATEQNRLVREVLREALTRLEEAARTEEEYSEITQWWDRLDSNRERKERYHEQSISDDMFDWDLYSRQIHRDNDIINTFYMCICQMHNLVDDPDLSRLTNEATDKQKVVFFPRIIAGCPTMQIAYCYGMTDRNVRKLIDLMLYNIREDIYGILAKRREDKQPLTLEQLDFLDKYKPKKKNKNNILTKTSAHYIMVILLISEKVTRRQICE